MSAVRKLLLVLLIIFVFATCKKDCESKVQVCATLPDCPPVVIDHFDCEPLPNHNALTTIFTEFGTQYMLPYFNPKDNDEFVYYRRNIESNEYDLIKYNLLSEAKLILFSGDIMSQPKWSSTGWIALNSNYQLFVVKSSGTNLEQLTEGIYNFDPAWSADGQKLYWMYTPNRAIPYYLLSNQIDTHIVDTLYYHLMRITKFQDQAIYTM